MKKLKFLSFNKRKLRITEEVVLNSPFWNSKETKGCSVS